MFRVRASAKRRFRGQLLSLFFIHWCLLVPVSGRINIVCILFLFDATNTREKREIKKNRIITPSWDRNNSRESPRRSSLFFIKIFSSRPRFFWTRTLQDWNVFTAYSERNSSAAFHRQLKVGEIPSEILRLGKDTLPIKLSLAFRSFSEHVSLLNVKRPVVITWADFQTTSE